MMHGSAKDASHAREVHRILSMTQSSFTGFSTIINRATPDHLDTKGPLYGMDLLQALGGGKGVYLNLPNLGVEMRFTPNSAILLTGKFLRHSVLEWRGRDRICVARWIRSSILDHFNIPHPQLPSLNAVSSYFT
jgi:hypothetical protein